MTWGGRLVSLFPLFYLGCILSCIGKMFYQFMPIDLVILPAVVYIMPVLIHRVHFRFFPYSDGFWSLAEKKYNPWWASHMFQFPFIALPWIESLLHFVPGLYSFWLRCWGSKIGKNVFWTPRVEILDRGLIEVGNGVVFGHIAGLSCHMVADMEGVPCLVIKKITIGEKSFIGADSQIGPGTIVAPRTKMKPKTRIYWRGEWP